MNADEIVFHGPSDAGSFGFNAGLPYEFVVSAYLVKDTRICLIDHLDLGLWLPPGGHPKAGEGPLAALDREILEETGWVAEVLADKEYYSEPNFVCQMPRPRFLQYEMIREEGHALHVHVNLAYFCRAIREVQQPKCEEGTIRWFEMHDLDTLEHLLPHTKMNAIAAIREMGNVIPKRLHVEQDRVLVPVGGRCRFHCIYCYTKRHDMYFGESDPSRVAELVAMECTEGRGSLTAQIGYDNDPFSDPAMGLQFIAHLLWLPVNIGFSTKAFISEDIAAKLAMAREVKKKMGFNLSALVTLTSLESASRLEPDAPSPELRLSSIKHLADVGIPVLVNLRPLLPSEVPMQELLNVIKRAGEAGACGIVLGAFWADPEGVVLSGLNPPTVCSQLSHIPWSPHGKNWNRYEDQKVVSELLDYTSSLGMHGFDSSARAVQYANQI